MDCCKSSNKQKSATSQLPTGRLENKPGAFKNILVWGLIIVFIIGFLAMLH